MRIVIATNAPHYLRPQAECMADVCRARDGSALVVDGTMLEQAVAFKADTLLCLGTGESMQPFLDAQIAPRNLLYLTESVPTPWESDDFTRGKLAAHRDSLDLFEYVFVHTSRSIPMIESLIGP